MAVQFRNVTRFAQLPLDQAKHIIYDELLPNCERNGVVLSRFGNIAYDEAPPVSEQYQQEKERKALFDITRIQKACRVIDAAAQAGSFPGFFSLKERVEAEVGAISTGDLVVAVLVRGHLANFHTPKTMECYIQWFKTP